MSLIEIDYLRQWIGRNESRRETLSATAATLLTAALDGESLDVGNGAALPPLFHWLYFPPVCRQSDLGDDGHPVSGGLLPPMPRRRRMWAASRIDFLHPLLVGDTVIRTTQITDVSLKEGRSGALIFVKLHHSIADSTGRAAIIETQDLVYRGDPKPDERALPGIPSPPTAAWVREVRPDPVLLFRYSALTFNSHRIHYDRPYATDVEGYPALLVHAPLVATLLCDHLRRSLPGVRVKRFEFRAVKPLFDDTPFHLCAQPRDDGRTVDLWSRDSQGALCTDARAGIE
jgi:3-methylfumaryl-CoA hydratase